MNWRDVVQQKAQAAAQAEATGTGRVMPYRWEHVQTVVRLAQWLAHETGADAEIVEAAAWLHDIAKTQPNHAQVGAVAARGILAETDFPSAKIERVVEAITHHEGLFRETVLEPLEAAVLWDADKLSKLGATGHLHMRAAGFSVRETTEATLAADLRWARDFGARIANSMNTRPALAEAARRLATIEAFNAALQRELQLGDLSGLNESQSTQRHEDSKG